jgi:predicted Zn-dependent protease
MVGMEVMGEGRQTGHVAEEWFRSPAWDESAQAEFEVRLGRARPRSRQQYLRIKGLALRDHGEVDGARALFQRVIREPGFDHEAAFAEEILGDLAAREGDRAAAERHYRRVLAAYPAISGTTGTVQISLAELLLDTGLEADRGEALALLNSWIADTARTKFDSQLFRWHLALIRAAEQAGDQETVRRAARAALELAGRGPQLSRHKDVGLVQTDPSTLHRLRMLVR